PTLANLADILLKAGRYAEAEAVFRRAYQVSSEPYMAQEQAVCLSKLGRFHEAYELIKGFPDLYFGVIEGEYGFNRRACQYEGYGDPQAETDEESDDDR